MRQQKTFRYYMIWLLKFISLMLFLAWLCSCSNRKQKLIDQITAYSDTAGMLKAQEISLKHAPLQDSATHSMRMAVITRRGVYERIIDSLKLELYK